MKKALLTALTLIIGLTVLAGCQTTTLSGKYYFISHIRADGTDITYLYEESGFNLDDNYLEFIDGKNCVMHHLSADIEMTYTVSGTTITFHEDNSLLDENGLTHIGTIDGNKITLVYNNEDSYVFEQR